MTVQQMGTLQIAVDAAIVAALESAGEGIPIYDFVPTNAEHEHIRLDGFKMMDQSFKDTERGAHRFQVIFHQRGAGDPSSGTFLRGNLRTQQVLAIIHEALKDLRVNRGRMQLLESDVSPGPDGTSHQGWLRYEIRL